VADRSGAGGLAVAAKAAESALGGLDTVIWCAGYWKKFDAAAWDAEEFKRHVEVNLLGLNTLLGAVLPGMVERGRGHVVGVASVAGYRGLPRAAAGSPVPRRTARRMPPRSTCSRRCARRSGGAACG
jgi:NADP-dependent 3-hydroxy acid dehydrogenase YdfG